MDIYSLLSLVGLITLIGFCYLFSLSRKDINWRIVVWGISIQVLFAWFLFIFPIGSTFFLFVNDVVVQILDSSMAGSKFLFGPLAVPPGRTGEFGETSVGFILNIQFD